MNVSCTTDIRTATNCNESFVSLTAHWIYPEFEFIHVVLNSSNFPGAHTGEAIAVKLTSLIDQWNLGTKLHVTLRDNAANMIKELNDAGLLNVSCMIHSLQLAIEDSIKS